MKNGLKIKNDVLEKYSLLTHGSGYGEAVREDEAKLAGIWNDGVEVDRSEADPLFFLDRETPMSRAELRGETARLSTGMVRRASMRAVNGALDCYLLCVPSSRNYPVIEGLLTPDELAAAKSERV